MVMSKMKTVNEIISELQEESSRNGKIRILEENRNNGLLSRVFLYAYDPFRNYWIKQTPLFNDFPNKKSLEWALDQLDSLADRTYTGNAASVYLATILSNLSSDDRHIIRCIINHDLECGVSEKTINKVWKGLIPSFNVMLCSKNDEKTRKNIEFPAIIQEKADGGRCIVIVQNGVVEYFTRNGKPIDFFGLHDEFFSMMANGENVAYDGEILVVDPETGDVSNRQTGNGFITKAVRGTLKKEDAENIIFQLWDRIPLTDFVNGKSHQAYKTRLANLETDLQDNKCDSISMIQTQWVNSFDEVDEWFDHFLSKGSEGIILKNANGIFENKRVKHQIKYKAELDCDLRVVGVTEGEGKYQGMLGALILESDCGELQVSCGSGFSDDERSIPMDDWFDKVVTVKYNAKIRDKGGKKKMSLFLPIFVSVREDKTVADREEDIK